ncbi:MAG: hypothetical protein ACJARR_003171 [Pseudophaeobacter arcticus]|jgi:hypothetical protein
MRAGCRKLPLMRVAVPRPPDPAENTLAKSEKKKSEPFNKANWHGALLNQTQAGTSLTS